MRERGGWRGLCTRPAVRHEAAGHIRDAGECERPPADPFGAARGVLAERVRDAVVEAVAELRQDVQPAV